MKKKIYILSLLLGFAISHGFAQVTYNKRTMGSIGTTPQADKFLNGATLDNVDKTTGTLKIGIPLYEIKVNDISIPISLNYSATGIKVNQEAGLPGMGWELNAGGKIITNIQGKQDAGSYGIQNNPIPEIFDISNSNNKTRIKNMLDNMEDNAWDTYNYILPNGGGTYTANGATYPYDPSVKIVHNAYNTISTTDGLVYDFVPGDRKRSSKITFYTPAFPAPNYTYGLTDPGVSEWSDYDLKTITSSRFKDVVTFNYNTITDTSLLNRKTRITTSETLPLYRNVTAAFNSYSYNTSDQTYSVTEPVISKSKMEYIQHTQLANIDFATGLVTFEYSYFGVLGRDVLTNIRIYKKAGSGNVLLKRYEFVYQPNPEYNGHYLDAVKIYNADNQYQESWGFAYNGHLPVRPDIQSNAQDEWGFYNGVTTNRTLLINPDSSLALSTVPHYPIVHNGYFTVSRAENISHYNVTPGGDPHQRYNINFANRSSNPNTMGYGMLTMVKTPTGGRYYYTYEPHAYFIGRYVGGVYQYYIKRAGGLRCSSVQKVLGSDGLYYGQSSYEKGSRKLYLYSNGYYSGSTEAPYGPGTVTVPWNVTGNISSYYLNNYPGQYDNANNYQNVTNLMLLSHPINNLEQYGGSYAMYLNVSELEFDDPYAFFCVGKTLYRNHLTPTDQALVYSPIADVAVPFLSANPGIPTVSNAGVYKVEKYTYDPVYDYFFGNEETTYETTILTPPATNGPLKSVYVTVAAEVTGNKASTMYQPADPLIDEPQPGPGLSSVNVFNTSATLAYGYMDFISRNLMLGEGYAIDHPFRYALKEVDLTTLSKCSRVTSERKLTFGTNYTVFSDTYTGYQYANLKHMLPTTTTTRHTVIDGANTDAQITRVKYPDDYNYFNGTLQAIKDTKMGYTEPIEQNIYRTVNGVETFQGGTVNTFKLDDGAVVPNAVYKVTPSPGAVGSLDPWGAGYSVNTGYFKQQISYDWYKKGQVHQYTELEGSKPNIILYGYNNQFAIAKVINVNAGNYDYEGTSKHSKEVAYTSFEAPDNGNWIFSGTPVNDAASPSGKKAYNLASGNITKGNATPAGKYILSYWYKAGATVNISGGTVGTPVLKNTWGGWTNAEVEMSNVTGTVTISGTGLVDEVRFHPKMAQMTTYLYDPMIGITDVIDANGRSQHYEYDTSQRLSTVRDRNGNMVKAYNYIVPLLY